MSVAGPNAEKCIQHAQFASSLDRWHFKAIYWCLFVANLLVLFSGSFIYIKAQDAISRYDESSTKLRKRLRLFIAIGVSCVCVSAVIVVMEAFALLALQFCDGEDLMSLYWSTWTMMQIGSLIAVCGVILALVHTLCGKRHPPWALALGTPVLVIAGLLHICYHSVQARCEKPRKSDSTDCESQPPMSRANTIRPGSSDSNDNTITGEFVGLTVKGGPIVRFANDDVIDQSENAELLGRCPTKGLLVAYRPESIRFLRDDEDVTTEIIKNTESNSEK